MKFVFALVFKWMRKMSQQKNFKQSFMNEITDRKDNNLRFLWSFKFICVFALTLLVKGVKTPIQRNINQ